MGSSLRRTAGGNGVVRRVLGVDPGTMCTGWGVVEESGRSVRYVSSGVVHPQGSRPDRLAAIQRAIRSLCAEFNPETVVIEQTFVGDNIQTAFRLGEARGAVMVAAAEADQAVVEYSPAEIKVAIVGSGRATKAQMQIMVGRLLGVRSVLEVDEADALGAAICHLHAWRVAAVLTSTEPRTPRRPRRSRWLGERR